MKRKNDEEEHGGMKLRSGKTILFSVSKLPKKLDDSIEKFIKGKKAKEGLAYDIYEEITTSIITLKDILSASDKFKSDFGSRIIETLLLIGKNKGIYRQDVEELINSKYYPLQVGQVLLGDKEVDEITVLRKVANNLMHIILGDHKKILSKKFPVLREDIEKAIISFFYKDSIDKEEREKIQSLLVKKDIIQEAIAAGEEVELIGNEQNEEEI